MSGTVAGLTLGGLSLVGGHTGGDWEIQALGDELDWGSPQPVDAVVRTLLQQGSKVVTQRYENREVFIRVRIVANDLGMLADVEAALFAELGGPNEMTWTPPDGYGPATVFRVVTSSLEQRFDDLDELRSQQTYGIRLVCSPFAYSASEVTVQAISNTTGGGVIDTLVDDCTSATGWAATATGTSVSVSSGAVVTSPTTNYPGLQRTGTISMTTTPILVVDIKTNGEYTPAAMFNGSGAPVWPSAVTASPTNAGYSRHFYTSPVTSISSVTFVRTGAAIGGGTRRPTATMSLTPSVLKIAEVRKQNSPPSSGTLRQKMFTALVPGSAPTEGQIEVSHGSSNLGTTLVYTTPADVGQMFGPNLRPYRTSPAGAATADAVAVSGANDDITNTGTVTFSMSTQDVTPGVYEVGAFLKSTTAATKTINVTADNLGFGDTVTFTTSVTFASANVYDYYPLGRLTLPLNRVPPVSDLTWRLTIGQASGSGSVFLDEAYLFNLDEGALTVVDSTSRNELTMVPATLDWPTPAVMLNGIALGSNVRAWGNHEIPPGLLKVFLVTRTAVDSDVALTMTAAWHSRAGQ